MNAFLLLCTVGTVAVIAEPLRRLRYTIGDDVAKRGRVRELFGKRGNGWIEMPIKKGREFFGRRNDYIDIAQKRRGRELFGKRSDPMLTMDMLEDKMYAEPDVSEDDPSMFNGLVFRLSRERRGRVRELLG